MTRSVDSTASTRDVLDPQQLAEVALQRPVDEGLGRVRELAAGRREDELLDAAAEVRPVRRARPDA